MKQVIYLTLILLLNLNTLLSATIPLVFAEEKIDHSEHSEVLEDINKELTEENKTTDEEKTRKSTISTSDEEEYLNESAIAIEDTVVTQTNEEQEPTEISLPNSGIGNLITFRAQSSNFNATTLVLNGNRLRASSPGQFIINVTGADVVEYSMDIYRLNSSAETISTENNIFSFPAMGNEQNFNANIRFNNTSPNITSGDILEVYHREPQRIFIGSGLDQTLPLSNNRAYLELTNAGYRLLQFDRVVSRKGNITTETSDEDLDNRIAEFLDTSDTPNIEVVGFIEYPDRSTIGSSSGKIRVQELLSTGRFIQKDYTVDFEIKSPFEFEIEPQSLYLSQTERALDFSKIISDVTYGGVALDATEYEVTIEKMVDTSTVGVKSGFFKVTHKKTRHSSSFEVPIHVLWGNSLYFRGAEDISIGTFTYDPGEQKIISNPGTAITSGVVHEYFASDSLYYSLNQHRLTEDKQLFEETNKENSHAATAGMQRSEAITSFGSGTQSIDTEIGDIIEVYHREPGERFQRAENEQLSNVSMNDNYTYFELTNSGYKQLYFDRVNVINGKHITSEMTYEDLDLAVSDYLDLSQAGDVEISGFVRYPDITVHGNTNGVIRVQEKLSTGRYVQKDYLVEFYVEYRSLKFMEVPSSFNFGSSILYSDRHQWITVENENKKNMLTVYDGREILTEWRVSAKASILVNSDRAKDNQINGARYNFSLDSGDRKMIMADGLSSTMITHGVNTNEKRHMDINLNNLELFLPRLSGMPGEHFKGEIVWTVDMVP